LPSGDSASDVNRIAVPAAEGYRVVIGKRW